MAFDPNPTPMDHRTMAEEPPIPTPIAPPIITAVRNPEPSFATPAARDIAPSGSVPVYYTVPIPDSGLDSGFLGLGFGKVVAPHPAAAAAAAAAAVAPAWGPQIPAPLGHPNASSVHGCNAVDNAANLGSRVGEGRDDSNWGWGKRVKFMCSFGGKILPRPRDGMLRYVGGQTRIVSLRRGASYGDFVQKMVDIYGLPVSVKYQLPDEDLDALVSVTCSDDLDNMMEEYVKLAERFSDGSSKLRLFLFSASELNSSGMANYDFREDGQHQYVNAVNGMDGGGITITRKESIASAASTQNSDLSGNEANEAAADSAGSGQGAGNLPPSSSAMSPRGNTDTSTNTAPRLVCAESRHANYAETPTVPLGVSVVTSTPQNLTPQPVPEIERTVPAMLQQEQMGLNFVQGGMEIPTPAPHLISYVDSHPGAINCAEYLQPPSQIGYPNGSVYRKPQLHDNGAGVSNPRHFIGVPQTTMAPSSSNIGIQPSLFRPLMQPQQSGDQSFHTYQAHISPAVSGAGSYGWHQVSPPEHVALPNAWVPQPQVIFPGKIQRFEDCYMCQKELPHAHSDTVVQDQINSAAGTVSGFNPVYHSFHPGDNKRSWPVNTFVVTEAPRVEPVEQHKTGAQLRTLDLRDNQVSASPSVAIGVAQISEASHESEQIKHQKVDNPYSVFMDTIPQSCQGDVMPPPLIPNPYLVKQGAFSNKPATSEISKRKPNDGAQNVLPHDAVGNEQGQLLVNNLRIGDIVEHRPQLVAHGELTPDGTSEKLNTVLDVNKNNATEKTLCLDFSYFQNSQMAEPREVVQQPNSDEFNHGNPASSGVDYTHLMDPVPSISDWENNIREFQPNLVPNSAENVPSNGTSTAPSSMSLFSRVEDVLDTSNSVFSIQVPWNYQHGANFSPPKLYKCPTKKEPFDTRDPLTESQFRNCEESNKEVQFEDRVNPPLVNLDESSVGGSAEELIGQELQAVAVGVASSVLHTSTSSHPREIDDSTSEAHEDIKTRDNDLELKHKLEEDIKTKLPDKINFGFPASDGIGRLQIIKNADLEELHELGSGTYGTVYHGKWRGSDVAIKRINDRCFVGKPSEQERMRADFWNEAVKLADLHHPNVVAFYGVVLDGPGSSIATVTEFMVNGSLKNSFQKNEKNLDKHKRLVIAMDVAFGMEYLHGRNIVHFDLKSDNLLVNLRDPHRPICKVGDLGLSKVKCQTLISGGVRGTLPWMAPELLNGSSSLVSEKVDVFSFGVVMWELLTREEPYADLHYGAIIGGIVSNTLRPSVPDSCDPEWRSLMEQCWSSEPSDRPSFTEIASQLRSIAGMIPPRVQTQQQQQSPLVLE